MSFVFKGVEEQSMHCGGPTSSTKLNEVLSETTFEYSGIHDHGKLPALKSDGPMSVVVNSLLTAKNQSDEYLTNCIDMEYGGVGKEHSKMKKSRTGETGSAEAAAKL